MQTELVRARCIPSSPRWLDSFYIGNLIRGLEREGISFCLSADDSGDFVSARWLRQHRSDVDLLHLHWTHYHYTRANWFDSLIELGKYVAKLSSARRLGYKIVWTMHNYMPHERTYPVLHYVERLAMARLAHAVIIHCAKGRELVRRRLLRRQDVFVVPLGNFAPFLPQPSRLAARSNLAIPNDKVVFLFFGSIRAYKGVPDLIQAFRQQASENLLLLVTGQPLTASFGVAVEELAAGDPRIRLRLEYVTDVELSAYLLAADLAVLPYRDVLGSGSVMAALGLGLPVVAPSIGCLAELITPDCGLTYDPDRESLADVLQRCIDLDLSSMRSAATARAQQFPWSEMVRQTAQVYHRALGSRS
jgi:beta-1,4-mannosyltransferase